MLLRRLSTFPTSGFETPFDELTRMQRQMDSLAGRLSGTRASEPFAGVYPLINVTEDKDNFYIRAEIPGLDPEAIEINVTGDSLTVSGERKFDIKDENARYHRKERETGKFNRVVNLPGQINTEKVSAHNKNGVLTVTLPKSEASKPRQVSIKGS